MKNALKKLLKWLPFFLLFIPFKVFSLVNRKRKDVVLFGTGTGIYHDNAKYLYEFYLAREQEYGCRAYWVAKNEGVYRELAGEGRPVVRQNSLKAAWLASRAAAYFITAEVLDVFHYIGGKTKLVQLWHGTPLKKICYDTAVDQARLERKNRIFSSNYSFSRFDHFIIEDQKFLPIFTSAFKLEERRFHPLGQPRNSLLLAGDQRLDREVRAKVQVTGFSKIFLYAPTFRDKAESNLPVYQGLINEATSACLAARNACLLVKLHPFLRNNQEVRGMFNWENIKDVSDYRDIQELLLISDALITDYSSVIFDFEVTGKPIYLYMPDLEEYTSARNGFYFTFQDAVSSHRSIAGFGEISWADIDSGSRSPKASDPSAILDLVLGGAQA